MWIVLTYKIQSIKLFILINLIILCPPELMFLLDQRVSNGVSLGPSPSEASAPLLIFCILALLSLDLSTN